MKVGMLLLLGITCLVNANPGEYRYMDSEQYAQLIERDKRSRSFGSYYRWDRIPIEFNEKILLSESESIASSILFVVPVPYGVAKDKLSEAIEKEYGIKSTEEYVRPLGSALVEEHEREKAKEMGIILDYYKKIEIVSKRYNYSEKAKSYSRLEVQIGNGMDILGKPYSFIGVKRIDNWRDWAGHPTVFQWLPWKRWVSGNIVTKSEVEFADKTIKELHPSFILSYPGSRIVSLCRYKFLTSFTSDLNKCEKNSSHKK